MHLEPNDGNDPLRHCYSEFSKDACVHGSLLCSSSLIFSDFVVRQSGTSAELFAVGNLGQSLVFMCVMCPGDHNQGTGHVATASSPPPHFPRLCHSVRVGVPLFTGRQPTRNGQRDAVHVFCVVPFGVGWRPDVHGTPTHAE